MVAIGYFLLLYFIALQNITNRGAPNQFPPPLRHNPCSAPASSGSSSINHKFVSDISFPRMAKASPALTLSLTIFHLILKFNHLSSKTYI